MNKYLYKYTWLFKKKVRYLHHTLNEVFHKLNFYGVNTELNRGGCEVLSVFFIVIIES